MSRLSELAASLTEHETAIKGIKAEMREILSGEGDDAPPAKKKPVTRKPRAATADTGSGGDDDGDKQPSLKEVVLQVIENIGKGELKTIVAGVKEQVDAGKYKTKAAKLTPVVSQALFGLKGEGVVKTTKVTDAEGRTHNLYSKA